MKQTEQETERELEFIGKLILKLIISIVGWGMIAFGILLTYEAFKKREPMIMLLSTIMFIGGIYVLTSKYRKV